MNRYNKTFMALSGFLGVLSVDLQDAHLDASEIQQLVLAGVGVILVFLIGNSEPDKAPADSETEQS